MMRILNAEPENYSAKARAILEQVGRVTAEPLSRADLLARLGEFDVLIVRLAHQVDREMIDAAPRLKAIVTATTGLNHVDTDYAASKGIAVLSLRGETAFLRSITATAEHTWALLLALVRHLPQATAHVLEGGWDRDLFKGHDLARQRLGLLGLGRIGCLVAQYGLAFQMPVAAYDPAPEQWVEGVTRVESMDALLRQSDILSVHVPLNDSTVHLLGAAELALLPHRALLINTARGEVIDEDALVDALTQNHLHGAAVDVVHYERDPARRARRLLEYARTHDNLIITPHIGGATFESMARTEVFMAEKLRTYLAEYM